MRVYTDSEVNQIRTILWLAKDISTTNEQVRKDLNELERRKDSVKTMDDLLNKHFTPQERALYVRHIDDGNTFEYLADEFELTPYQLREMWVTIEGRLKKLFARMGK